MELKEIGGGGGGGGGGGCGKFFASLIICLKITVSKANVENSFNSVLATVVFLACLNKVHGPVICPQKQLECLFIISTPIIAINNDNKKHNYFLSRESRKNNDKKDFPIKKEKKKYKNTYINKPITRRPNINSSPPPKKKQVSGLTLFISMNR